MIYRSDKAALIRKMCKVMEMISLKHERDIKLGIIERVDLLDLQKEIEEILEKCSHDGY